MTIDNYDEIGFKLEGAGKVWREPTQSQKAAKATNALLAQRRWLQQRQHPYFAACVCLDCCRHREGLAR